MESVRDSIVGPVRKGLLVLLGAVALVLLVVCANVANLVLVRGTARVREMALRSALGAGRHRIVRLLLTESLLLALVGGVLGVLAAWWGVRTIVALSGQFLPRAADVRVDGGVLAFAVAISAVTGVLFGLWPALRTSAAEQLSPSLREDARGSAGGTGAANRARAALVMAEVALAVVLVVGAGLMLRSFQRLTSVDPGFRADGVLLVRMSIKFDDDTGDRETMLRRRLETKERILERVRAIPGVVGAGATKFAPFAGEGGEVVPFTVPGQPAPAPGAEPRVALQPASPGYLRTLGVPLVTGQDIDAAAGDSTNAVVAVINRRMAERFWPGRSPVGESFVAFGNTPVRIIGVAGDVRSMRLDSVPDYAAYLPDRVMPRSAMSIVVRTSGDPMRLAGLVRAAIREVLPGQAFQEVTPLRSKLSDAASTPRFFTVLVTIFGVLALALAAIGLYGVVSYVVRQREREMAVRMALGAPPARVLSLMLRQGMTPVAIGLTVGLVGAFVVTRVLRSLLFEVSATDPLTFAGVAALLGAIALLASYLPSRRATRVHPATILRAE
jgi:predicted permease